MSGNFADIATGRRGTLRQSAISRRSGAMLTMAGICLAMLLPVIALIVIAVRGDTEGLNHLFETSFADVISTTLLLMAGVATLTALIGTVTAWLVTFYDFPFRRWLSVGLVLPFAIPTYIASYTFVEYFSYTGPIQEMVRAIGGYTSSRDYWFPDIRSLGGAIFVLALVLFPYVYIATRALFQLQSGKLADVARVLGASQQSIFIRVLVPMARPAIMVGVTLAVMETINDIGAIEYMGVQTLTYAIFNTWLNQGDLEGAAQIALVLLFIAFLLVAIERWARRQRSFVEKQSSTGNHIRSRVRLSGPKSWIAFLVCCVPVFLGFGIPIWVLFGYAITNQIELLDGELLSAVGTSLLLAGCAAGVTVLIALYLTYQVRKSKSVIGQILVRISALGYAVPGTVIGLGLLIPLASLDNLVDGVANTYLGFGTGLLISGTGVILVYAYAVRFLAMAEGSLDSGFKKLSPQLDAASRSLGRNSRQTLYEVLLPLMRPTILTAGLLVFIDSIKELSATIMLRPFGVNTLSTYIYDFASLSRVDEVGIACLIVVLIGLFPAILVSRTSWN